MLKNYRDKKLKKKTKRDFFLEKTDYAYPLYCQINWVMENSIF